MVRVAQLEAAALDSAEVVMKCGKQLLGACVFILVV
jgi:hypothetical protein